MAKSASERQQKRRQELKDQHLKSIYVRGKDGEYDERIRVALAVKNLALRGELPPDIVNLIIDEAAISIPTKDRVNELFVKKLITNYLSNDNE
ncbi:hypothetical protein KPM64_003623 [Vibrio cholerae]|uniref:hypothetical protein n=1 Tax=Vibrio metoecus TaxID=1481663 RepID=UPI000BA910FF|nr:hypothetical protein [Vibrio metoecus]EHP5031025.1 hypothetical protein [Vibrio cholerae]PAR33949.1 hypothetical protein CGT97_18555 [Vibrio metoecus]PAR42030.1 hypothetical protein CGT96_14380 [Vibrio metoecus]